MLLLLSVCTSLVPNHTSVKKVAAMHLKAISLGSAEPEFQTPVLPKKDPWIWEALAILLFLHILLKF